MNKKEVILEFLKEHSADIPNLSELLNKRMSLTEQLAKIDKEIADKLKVSDEVLEEKPTGTRRRIAQEVCGLLEKAEGGLTPTEIAKQLDAKYQSVFQALKGLVNKGKVAKKDDKYFPTKSPQAELPIETKKGKKK